jgi:hypothetical protein
MPSGAKTPVDELLGTAQQHLDRNEVAQADAIARRVLNERPNHKLGLLLAASIATRKNDHRRAEYVLARVLQRDPKCVPALCMLGLLQRHLGDARKTLGHLLRGLQTEFGLGDGSPIEVWQTLVYGVEGAAPVALWRHRMREFEAIAWALHTVGHFAELNAVVHARLAEVDFGRMDPSEAGDRASALMVLAGFSKAAPWEWNHHLFENVILRWMKRCLETERYDAALHIEEVVLAAHVPQKETEAHFASTVGRWSDAMRAAGQKLSKQLPPLAARKPNPRPRIAFFAHRLTQLAHIRLLVDMLEGHAALAEPLFEPLIFGLRSQWDEATVRRLANLGIEVKVANLGSRNAGAADLIGLRDTLGSRSVDAVVWVSFVHLMSFAFAMRVAPAQIWWAMKYHSLEMPEIDGYLAFGAVAGGTRLIGGRPWRAGPIAAEDWFDPQLTAEAAQVRSTFAQHPFLYGCFGREEKLNSASFLAAVSQILEAVPEAAFLWTGRTKNPDIQATFEKAGVADRCHFIGWVNTRLYAQVIDVFLDSFPFPCGYTLYEALAARKPAVLYASAEAAETGLRSFVEPVLAGEAGSEDQSRARSIFTPAAGEDLYLCAADAAQYVDYAVRLGNEPSFRARAGAAGAEFVHHFMSDRKRLGRIYGEHIVAIVREKAAA